MQMEEEHDADSDTAAAFDATSSDLLFLLTRWASTCRLLNSETESCETDADCKWAYGCEKGPSPLEVGLAWHQRMWCPRNDKGGGDIRETMPSVLLTHENLRSKEDLRGIYATARFVKNIVHKVTSLSTGDEVGEAELRQLLMLCRVNAHGILCPILGKSVGVGLYPAGGSLNHACRPNVDFLPRWQRQAPKNLVPRWPPPQTLHLSDEPPLPAPLDLLSTSTMRFVAVRRIVKGEELTIPYTDVVSQSAGDRREHLRSEYFFDCRCDRCLADHATSTNQWGHKVRQTVPCVSIQNKEAKQSTRGTNVKVSPPPLISAAAIEGVNEDDETDVTESEYTMTAMIRRAENSKTLREALELFEDAVRVCTVWSDKEEGGPLRLCRTHPLCFKALHGVLIHAMKLGRFATAARTIYKLIYFYEAVDGLAFAGPSASSPPPPPLPGADTLGTLPTGETSLLLLLSKCLSEIGRAQGFDSVHDNGDDKKNGHYAGENMGSASANNEYYERMQRFDIPIMESITEDADDFPYVSKQQVKSVLMRVAGALRPFECIPMSGLEAWMDEPEAATDEELEDAVVLDADSAIRGIVWAFADEEEGEEQITA